MLLFSASLCALTVRSGTLENSSSPGADAPFKTSMITNGSFGQNLPRTMALLESASETHRTPVRILFYGQSIVGSGYADKAIKKYLGEKYPFADLDIKNTAIGGYEAPKLRKTAWADLYSYYPDLVVFHVYGGGNGELEEIYSNLQKYTTAEVLTWTHHVDNLGVDRERDEESELREKLAAKYGQEIADVRSGWRTYLADHHLRPEDLLVDHKIHLNEEGGELLGKLLVPHFQDCLDASHDWERRIKTYDLTNTAPDITFDPKSWHKTDDGLVARQAGALRVKFTGNRIDLVGMASGPTAGTAKILLDGYPPSTLPETFTVTRASKAPGAWWPAVDRVILGPNPVTDNYTMAFHDVSPDGTKYQFELRSKDIGAEGSGKSGEDFVSQSGRIRINAKDIDLAAVKRLLKKDLPSNFDIGWQVYSMSHDSWKAPSVLDNGRISQNTVIQFWDSGSHVLEIIPNDDGPVGIQKVMVFNPEAK